MPNPSVQDSHNKCLHYPGYYTNRAYLDEHKRLRFAYEPSIDAIAMLSNSGLPLREGLYMPVTDSDLIGGTDYVLINSVTISEGEALIPTYRVTLLDERPSSFLQRTSGKTDTIERQVVWMQTSSQRESVVRPTNKVASTGGSGGGGGTTTSVSWGSESTDMVELSVSGSMRTLSKYGHKHVVTDITNIESWIASKGYLTSATLDGYVTDAELASALSGYVDLTNAQTIGGAKTFSASLTTLGDISAVGGASLGGALSVDGDVGATGDISGVDVIANGSLWEYDQTSGEVVPISQKYMGIGVAYTKAETDALLAGKQSTLTQGDNITISNGVISAKSGIYLCTYGTTTPADLVSAVSAGQLPICEHSDHRVYVFSGIASNAMIFTSVVGGTIYGLQVNVYGTWSELTPIPLSGFELTSNKVTSLSASSTDSEYPSAKCVYDLIGDIETLLTSLL